VIPVLVTIVIIYFKIIRPQKRLYDICRAQGVNGEPFVPLIGQLPEIRRYREADKLMDYPLDQVKRYGYTYLFGFGPIIRLVVAEPDLLADIFSRTNAQNYMKPPIVNTAFSPIIGEQNLLVAEGKEHERARRMLNPAFHHINLKSMVSIITDQTAKTIEELFSTSSSDQKDKPPVDIQIQLNALTLSIISSSAFGSGFETITNAKEILCRTFGEVLEATVYRSLFMINQIPILKKLPFWRKDIIDNGARRISDFVDHIIADRRQGHSTSMSNGSDLLDLLLSAVDNEGQPFTDQQVKEQALAFVLAGSETTGNLMTWIFHILMTHDDVLAACQEEVDRVLPNGIEPTNDHLADLVICEAIINETLRLYPPAPMFTRQCIHEHVIGTDRQLRIPAGITVMINSFILHRRSDLWPRPDEFDYTRWIRDPKTGLKPKLPHAYAYLPFAAGPRSCIGQNFALLEAKIMLAMFIQRCNFQLVPGQKIVPEFKITMRPKYGLWLKVSKRQI
jgi:cytochrome P450